MLCSVVRKKIRTRSIIRFPRATGAQRAHSGLRTRASVETCIDQSSVDIDRTMMPFAGPARGGWYATICAKISDRARFRRPQRSDKGSDARAEEEGGNAATSTASEILIGRRSRAVHQLAGIEGHPTRIRNPCAGEYCGRAREECVGT